MEIRPLSDNLQRKAISELNEDPHRSEEFFEHIKEWLRKQPHLNIKLDDQKLVAFCRGCKWNLQSVKLKMDTYYTCKTLITELYSNRDPMSSEIQNVLNSGVVFMLPKLQCNLGPRVCMFNVSKVDPVKTPVTSMMKVFFMIIDILMEEDDDFVISGLILLADYNQFPPSLMLQYTPPLMKKFFNSFQNAYPIRIKGFTAFNAPTILDTIYNFCKPFVSKKIQDRINVLSTENTKRFINEFPKESLPMEYGGSNGSMNTAAEDLKKKIESYRDWFLEDQKYGSIEKLRVEKSKLFENEFGIEGSFRKLIID